MKTYVIKLDPAVNIRLYVWGLALVTIAEDDEWVAWFRRFMFPSSRKEYWFLTRHLWRNWWWIDATARKRIWRERPRTFRRWSGIVEIPAWEYDFLKRKDFENVLRDKQIADRCFDEIIGGLEIIKGKPVDAAKLQEHLKGWKAVFAEELLKRNK